MNLGAPLLRRERDNARVVAHGKIKMDRAHSATGRSCGRGPLLCGSTPVINQIRFHRRHPPMARPSERNMRVAVPGAHSYHCSGR
jgi:hypothetical protein